MGISLNDVEKEKIPLTSIFFPSVFFHPFNPFPKKPWFSLICSKSILKTLREKEKLLVTSNFSFSPQCFLPFRRTFWHFHQIWNCRLQTLSVWKGPKFVVWERVKQYRNGENTSNRHCQSFTDISFSLLNPFPNKPWCLRVCRTTLLKNTVGKWEIARKEQFLLFWQCFLPLWKTFCHFH